MHEYGVPGSSFWPYYIEILNKDNRILTLCTGSLLFSVWCTEFVPSLLSLSNESIEVFHSVEVN